MAALVSVRKGGVYIFYTHGFIMIINTIDGNADMVEA
jgi:hypothetical protein